MAGIAAGIVIGKTVQEVVDTGTNSIFQGVSMIPILLVVTLLVLMKDLIIKILKVFPIMVRMAVQLLQPVSFVNDLVHGIIVGIEKLITGVADIFIGKAQESGEKIPGFKNGLFPNGILGASKETKDAEDTVRCLKPTTIRLILMVLCPPFAVFMKYGLLRGWLWIIICWILTYYFYYFPGLLFSALHTMCF